MTWLLWRQHRAQALVTAIVFALFAIAVVITGIQMANLYDNARQACPDGSCVLGNLFAGKGAIIDTVHLTLVLPVLLGVFLGATLIARETEQQTNILAWTQTVPKGRWLAIKIAFALSATLLVSAATSALVTWWSGPSNSLHGDRFEGVQFDTQNVAPVAFALFAVALGLAMGALFRRVLPAIAATVGGYLAVRLVVSLYVRPIYLAASVLSSPLGADLNTPPGSRILSSYVLDPAGNHLSNIRVPAQCIGASRDAIDQCVSNLGYHVVTKYQPPSHYWPFQWIESGLFVGLAAVLVVVAVVVTLRRDA